MAVTDDLKQVADSVCQAVDDALTNNDFTGLGNTVNGLVKGATDAVKHFTAPAGAKSRPEQPQRERLPQEEHPERYFARAESEQGPKIAAVVGGAMAVVFGTLTVIFALLSFIMHGFGAPLVVLMGLMTTLGIAMGLFGHRAARKRERFKSYRNLILPRLYADVDELSEKSGRTEKEVVSDLKGYMRSGMIRQGHFDEKETCFIASDDLYRQYQETASRAKEQKRQQEEQAKRENTFTPEVREILTKGNEYIAAIRKANDEIEDQEISDKLDKMEQIVGKIFEAVRQKPELAGKLNMFMTYYLPTTTKLMDAYVEMDRQPVQGENIMKAKREISNSLSTINDAFEKLLDSFFREQAMDVSSDINVMKMMMKQEGLTEDDLTAMRRRQDAQMYGSAQSAAAQSAAQTQSAVQTQSGTQMQQQMK